MHYITASVVCIFYVTHELYIYYTLPTPMSHLLLSLTAHEVASRELAPCAFGHTATHTATTHCKTHCNNALQHALQHTTTHTEIHNLLQAATIFRSRSLPTNLPLANSRASHELALCDNGHTATHTASHTAAHTATHTATHYNTH